MDTTSNYFNLPDPQELFCDVWLHRTFQSCTVIRVSRDREQALWRLVFLAPTYFRGPMTWKGADFRLGTLEEFLDLGQRTAMSMTQAEWMKEYEIARLFIAEADLDTPFPKTVEILAISAKVYPVEAKQDDHSP